MATQNLGRVGLVLKGEWDSTTAYTALDVVSHDGNAWAAKQNSTNVEPTTGNSDFWQLFSNNADLVATVQGYKEDAASSAAAAAASAADAAADAQYGEDAFNAIAHTFSTSTAYTAGQYVWYNGELYRFNTAHPAGTWIGTDAARYTATDEFPLIQQALGTKADAAEVANLKSALTAYQYFSAIDLTTDAYNALGINSVNGKWQQGTSGTPKKCNIKSIPNNTLSVHVTANADYVAIIAFLSTNAHVTGTMPDYVGDGTIEIQAGTTQEILVPSGAVYLYVQRQDGASLNEPDAITWVSMKDIPMVDDTLSIAGDAADAKETGDRITETNDRVDDIEAKFPHVVTLLSLDSVSTGKYIGNSAGSMQIGDNWTEFLTNNTGSLYTPIAIDVSEYIGEKLTVEIGASDSHSGIRMMGFCDAQNIVSWLVTEAHTSYESADGFLRAQITISNDYFFFSCSAKSHLKITVNDNGSLLERIGEEIGQAIVYVSPSGNDDNPGIDSTVPVATVNKALDLGAETVCMMGGEYKQTVNLAKARHGRLSIVSAEPSKQVIFKAPDCVIADTETAVTGYTKVYSAQTAKTFHANNIWIFQDGVPDATTEITSGKRMPEQRGKVYRCDDTRISKSSASTLAAALTDIESSADYKWYLDSGTIYFSRPSAVSAEHPICGSFGTSFFSNGSRKNMLELAGITVKYMAFNIENADNARIVDCAAANVFGGGAFLLDGAVEAELIRCDASRAYNDTNGDGFNAHAVNTGDPFAYQSTATLIDCWAHDNNDDGISYHNRGEISLIGGLYEQNYHGGGITPANGCHCTCLGVYSRDNGEGGFLYMNDTAAAEGGVGGQMKCIDCIAESNTINSRFVSAGYKVNANGNKAILIGCKALNENNGYYVAEATSAMDLIDCGAYNCTNVKGGQATNITVKNTTIVT